MRSEEAFEWSYACEGGPLDKSRIRLRVYDHDDPMPWYHYAEPINAPLVLVTDAVAMEEAVGPIHMYERERRREGSHGWWVYIHRGLRT